MRFSLSRMRICSSRCASNASCSSTSAFSASTSLGSSRSLTIAITRSNTDVAREVTAESRLLRVDSLEQHRHLRAIDLDARSASVDALERAALEALVEEPEAVAVPHQHLHTITPLVEEAEQRSRERILSEGLPDDRHQAI